jgi:hypothetical protein
LSFRSEEKIVQREEGDFDILKVARCSFGNVDESYRRIMSNEGEHISTWRPHDIVDPAADKIFSKKLPKSDFVTKRGWWRALVDVLDSSREDSGFEVTRSSQEKDVVWVPSEAENG